MSVDDHVNFLRRLKERGRSFNVFYDIGANIGRWSQSIQQDFPDARFEMFEPLAGRMKDVDASSLVSSIPNATLHAIALSDKTGAGEIKVLDVNGEGSSILVLESDRRKNIDIIPCPMYRLDDYLAEAGLPQPDFLKLDTQASELLVLKGAEATLRNTKFILLETWMRRVYGPGTPLFHEVANWLYAHDFMLYEMLSLQEGRDADGTLRWFDAVFISKRETNYQPYLM